MNFVLLAELDGASAHGHSKNIAEQGFLEGVRLGKGLVQGGCGVVSLDDADARHEFHHVAFIVAGFCKENHPLCDRRFLWHEGFVFLNAFLKGEEEQLGRTACTEEALCVAKNGDGDRVVRIVEPCLASAGEAVNEQGPSSASVVVAAR